MFVTGLFFQRHVVRCPVLCLSPCPLVSLSLCPLLTLSSCACVHCVFLGVVCVCQLSSWSNETVRCPCGVCCVACVHKYMIFTCFLHVMVLVPLIFHNVSIVFCLSLQFQALFHMLSNVNMWTIAWNCCEKQKTIDTLWKVNGLFRDTASSPTNRAISQLVPSKVSSGLLKLSSFITQSELLEDSGTCCSQSILKLELCKIQGFFWWTLGAKWELYVIFSW